MKRKIFSKLLMGALLVASISSFTSCKDYDDDIKKNTDDISALTKQISTLETALNTTKQEAAANYATKTEIAKLATAEALQKSINDLQAKVQGNSSKTIAELANDIDAINPKLNTLGTTLDNIQTAAQAAIKNIELQQTVLDRLQKEVEGDGSSIAGLKDDVATLKDEVAKVKTVIGSVTSLDELAQKMTELSNKVDDAIDVLTVLVSGSLKSLVFQPDFYFGGIEATEAPAILYTPLKYGATTTAANRDVTYKKTDGKNYYIAKAIADNDAKKFKLSQNWGASWIGASFVTTSLPDGTPLTAADFVNFLTPNVIAKYHMNPSTVKKENIVEVSVISDDKLYLTRAAASKPAVKVWDAADGILTAELGVTYKDIAKAGVMDDTPGVAANDGLVTVFATQAHYKDAAADTTITSDYAAISPVAVRNLIISDNAALAGSGTACAIANYKGLHVFRNATDAIAGNASHKIAWNSTGFDLSKVIEVHYDKVYFSGNNFTVQKTVNDVLATPEQLKHWGLELKYSLVEYTKTTNFTEQTLPHMTINGSIVTPTGINGSQTRASIGREPLVKVELIDTNTGNQLAQIGYVKFQITAEEAEAVDIVVNEATQYFTCVGPAVNLKWDVVEGKILDDSRIRANGISKTNFENDYAVDMWKDADEKTINTIGWTSIPGTTYLKVADKWVSVSDIPGLHGDGINGTPTTPSASLQSSYTANDWVVEYNRNEVDPVTGEVTNRIRFKMTEDQVRVLLAKKNTGSDKTTKPYLTANGTATNDIALAALEDEFNAEFAIRMYDKAEGGRPDVYVVFKEKISKLALTINKISDYWYASNNVSAKSGYDEIHISVPVIGETTPVADVANFKGDFANTIVKNVLGVTPKANPQQEAGYTVADLSDVQRAEIAYSNYPAASNPIYTTMKFYTDGTIKAKVQPAGSNIVVDGTKGEEFTGYSGTKYLLVPDPTKAELYAIAYNAANKNYSGTSAKVVSLKWTDGVTDAKAQKYEFELEDNDIAKDLVNAASHKDLANSLTAHVQVSANLTCDATIPVIVTNDKFDVKFLRPIDVVGQDAKIFRDATDGGNLLQLLDLLKLNDWREQWAPKFGATDADLFAPATAPATGVDYTKPKFPGATKNYFVYYKVNVSADIDNITTDLNGGTLGTTKLSDVTTNAKFFSDAQNDLNAGTYAARTWKLIGFANANADASGAWNWYTVAPYTSDATYAWSANHRLRYENNQTTVGTFKVRVPLNVTYYWGTLKTYIDVEVKNTLEN